MVPLKLHYFSGGARERVFSALLDAGHTIERAYFNDPERWPKLLATVDLAKSIGIPVYFIRKKAELSSLIPELRGKVCLSVGFNYLFPQALLDEAEIVLNVHGSLLPKYPGARTLSWLIENGDCESGVTVHIVDKGIDSGPIILQKKFLLSPFETIKSLSIKTLEFEPAVVIEALAKYERDGVAGARPIVSSSEHPPNRIPEHSKLDPSQSLLSLFNKIRASDPDRYPAYFEIFGEKVFIRMWRPNKPDDEADQI